MLSMFKCIFRLLGKEIQGVFPVQIRFFRN